MSSSGLVSGTKDSKDVRIVYIWLVLWCYSAEQRAALLPSEQDFVDTLWNWHALSSDSKNSEFTVRVLITGGKFRRETIFRVSQQLLVPSFAPLLFPEKKSGVLSNFVRRPPVTLPRNGSFKRCRRGEVDERKRDSAPLKWDLFLFLHILRDCCLTTCQCTMTSLCPVNYYSETAVTFVSPQIQTEVCGSLCTQKIKCANFEEMRCGNKLQQHEQQATAQSMTRNWVDCRERSFIF